MKRRILPLLSALLAALLPLAMHNASAATCAAFWKRVGPLRETAHGLLPTGEIPEHPIRNVEIKSLIHQDGREFTPDSLSASNCYLDRVLQQNIKDALLAAARATTFKSSDQAIGDQLGEVLRQADLQLTKATGDDGPAIILSLFSYTESVYPINGLHTPHPTRLEATLFARGIYRDQFIVRIVWLEYMRHLGARNLDVDRFIEFARVQDASMAPPKTLTPPGCSPGIRYHWPTDTLPIVSYSDSEPDVDVHWGVCTRDESLWVYQYRHGWKQVQAPESRMFCDSFDGKESQFDSACRRR